MTEDKLNDVLKDGGDIEISIPKELQGHGIVVNYGTSWISNLRVNDSNNTITGTVAANTTFSSRSTTITLTASGNLSTISPYSFKLYQDGRSESCDVKINFSGSGKIYAILVKLNGRILYTTSGFNLPYTTEFYIKNPDWGLPVSGNLTFEYSRTSTKPTPELSGTVSPNYATFPIRGSVTLNCSAYN